MFSILIHSMTFHVAGNETTWIRFSTTVPHSTSISVLCSHLIPIYTHSSYEILIFKSNPTLKPLWVSDNVWDGGSSVADAFAAAAGAEFLAHTLTNKSVTLLCFSQSRFGAMEEVKEKLLQFLLQHSQTVLLSSGCPIEKVCKLSIRH